MCITVNAKYQPGESNTTAEYKASSVSVSFNEATERLTSKASETSFFSTASCV